MTALIQLESATYRYPDGRTGLDDCSFALRAGTCNALLGPNGAGKTTLMQHLNGLLRPAQGRLLWQGQPVDYGRAGLRQLRQQVGLVFQNPDRQLFCAHVEEDVAFGPLNLGLPQAEVRRRVDDALAAVGLQHQARAPVHQLSFGQKKRVCLAGVLAMSPRLLVLDEPMAGLDAPMQADLQGLLDQLAATGVTVLLSTHDAAFAAAWADEIHVMAGGACRTHATTDHLLKRPGAWREAGHEPPPVMALHAALVRRGVLQDGPVPRSIGQLLVQLRDTPMPVVEGQIHHDD